MGDTLKKVQPGQRMVIPAQTFNRFIDAGKKGDILLLEGRASLQ